MIGPLINLGLNTSALTLGQTQRTSPINLQSLNTELQGLTTNEARRALILRLFGSNGNLSLPPISVQNRTTAISVFSNLRTIIENPGINISPEARIRAFRFLSRFANGIGDSIADANPLDPLVLQYEQYNEVYQRTAGFLETISRIQTLPRTGNALRLPAGFFAGLPYHSPPEGVNFNPQSQPLRWLVQGELVNAINRIPENVEIVCPRVTEDNHEAVERDFELLQSLVTETGRQLMTGEERRAYKRLLLLCATYGDQLSGYHSENNERSGEYLQLAQNYLNQLRRLERQDQESAPPTGPEINDQTHRLTILRNALLRFQTQLQSTTSNEQRKQVKRNFIMGLFETGSPECPLRADVYHRGTATVIFHQMLAILEDPDIDIPIAARIRGLRFLSSYAENIADYMDRQERDESEGPDPSVTIFCEYSTSLTNAARTLETIDQVSQSLDNTINYTVRLPAGALRGLPYRFVGLPDTDGRRSIESLKLKKLIESLLVKTINQAWETRGGILLQAPENATQEELNYLSRLASSLSCRDNLSDEQKKALPLIWLLCSSYALRLGNGQLSSSCIANSTLFRELPSSPPQTPTSNLSSATVPIDLILLDIIAGRATDNNTKTDLIRRLFERTRITFSLPANFSHYSPQTLTRIFNKLKQALEDPSLNIEIGTRARGFRFLSNFASNYAQMFPEGSQFAAHYARLATTYQNIAGTLDVLTQLPQRAQQGQGQSVRLSAGNLLGLPFHSYTNIAHSLSGIENTELRNMIASYVVTTINSISRTLDPPQITSANVSTVVQDFDVLFNLASYLHLGINNSNQTSIQTLQSLSPLWSVCNNYATALTSYYDNLAQNTTDELHQHVLLNHRNLYRGMGRQATLNSQEGTNVLITRLLSNPFGTQVAQAQVPPVTQTHQTTQISQPQTQSQNPGTRLANIPFPFFRGSSTTISSSGGYMGGLLSFYAHLQQSAQSQSPPVQAQPQPQAQPEADPEGSIRATVGNGQSILLNSFAFGIPPANQANFYQRSIRFSCSSIIASEHLTFTGNGTPSVQNPNPNLSITNIPGVCCIYRRRNPDGTYNYSIGVFRDYRGTIRIGNQVIFTSN